MRAWRKFFRLPPTERLLAAEAFAWLLVSRLLLLAVPFPQLARRLGTMHAPSTGEHAALTSHPRLPVQIGRIVDKTADAFPLCLVCLPRALAASQMLARRGIRSRLHFGAARLEVGGPMTSHAWLDAGGVEVTGYPIAQHFVEVGYFVR